MKNEGKNKETATQTRGEERETSREKKQHGSSYIKDDATFILILIISSPFMWP